MSYKLMFDPSTGITKTLEREGITIEYRAFENIVYVENPVDLKYHTLNLFVPEAYYRGESINGYTAETAPILFPNTVGGYMAGEADKPGCDFRGITNPAFYGLAHGYVVASPGLRGRTMPENGRAPACIVDYKAAVRYLRANAGKFPGDVNKMISNGTSAGGALSAMLGATGNHPDYEPYLKAIGAADEKDHIFASNCFCPIINLENADLAYEWLFADIDEFSAMRISMVDGKHVFTPVEGVVTEAQKAWSKPAQARFAPYVDSLGLKTADGAPLDTAALRGKLKDVIADSLQRAADEGKDLSGLSWVSAENGKIGDFDFEDYLKDVKRMKTPLPFDAVDCSTGENDLFGLDDGTKRHFSALSAELDPDGAVCDPAIVRMLNPMEYVGKADTVKHWRIRHGAADRDTSLAVPVLFVELLRANGCVVDFHSPWGVPHAGDYGVDEMFAWIDSICK